MKSNVGNVDRVVRVVAGGAALLGAATVGFGNVGGVVLLLVGGVLIGTAALGFCPLHRVLGLSTRPARQP